jgi:hypothetical protein
VIAQQSGAGQGDEPSKRSRVCKCKRPRHSCGRALYTESRESSSGRGLDACLRGTVKLRRAHGGCLGSQRRRRTWTAAKSSGELLTSFDPEVSEWGNPRRDYLPARGEYIAVRQPSQGTETS